MEPPSLSPYFLLLRPNDSFPYPLYSSTREIATLLYTSPLKTVGSTPPGQGLLKRAKQRKYNGNFLAIVCWHTRKEPIFKVSSLRSLLVFEILGLNFSFPWFENGIQELWQNLPQECNCCMQLLSCAKYTVGRWKFQEEVIIFISYFLNIFI